MKKVSLMMVMGLLIVGMATAAFGWGGGHGGWGRGPGYGPCMGGDVTANSGLNLTAEQQEKIQALQVAQRKEIKPLQDKMFAKRGDLKLLWLERSPDQEKILAAQKELRNLRGQMEDKMTEHKLAIYKVLTPEQQSKIQSYRGKGFGFGQGRHGKGFGPGAGGCVGYGPRGY